MTAMLSWHEHACMRYVLGSSRLVHPAPLPDLRKSVQIAESTARQLSVDPAHSADTDELHAVLRILRAALAREEGRP